MIEFLNMVKNTFYIFIIFLFSFNASGQVIQDTLSVDKSNIKGEDKETSIDVNDYLFSYSIHKHIDKFITQSNIAYKNKNLEEAKSLFDSLVINHLRGKKFDDFNFKRLSKKNNLSLKDVKKPIFLITYSTWCITSMGEIPALNNIADTFKDQVRVIVLYWDRKESLRKIASSFSDNIEFCYAHDTYNDDNYMISTLKHTLGFPTTFLIDKDMKVVDIKKGGVTCKPKSDFKETYNLNMDKFQSDINELLSKKDTVSFDKNSKIN